MATLPITSESPQDQRRERRRAYAAKWRAENRERHLADQRKSYYAHQEARQAYGRAYGKGRTAARQTANLAKRAARQEAQRQTDPIARLTPLDLAYLAGLFDGEGHIGLTRTADRYVSLTAGVTMTHQGVLQWLADLLGLARLRNSPPRRNLNHRQTYVVRLSGARAAFLCERLLPFLRVKQEQALLAVEFGRLVDKHHKMTEDDRATRMAMWHRMADLNRRGRDDHLESQASGS